MASHFSGQSRVRVCVCVACLPLETRAKLQPACTSRIPRSLRGDLSGKQLQRAAASQRHYSRSINARPIGALAISSLDAALGRVGAVFGGVCVKTGSTPVLLCALCYSPVLPSFPSLHPNVSLPSFSNAACLSCSHTHHYHHHHHLTPQRHHSTVFLSVLFHRLVLFTALAAFCNTLDFTHFTPRGCSLGFARLPCLSPLLSCLLDFLSKPTFASNTLQHTVLSTVTAYITVA